jgi:ubiquinone/menaquinone biosynthesis C-methylase UbiE
MQPEDRYLEVNKKAWNTKTAYHVASPFYDMPSFIAGQTTLKDIELGLLGDVTGRKVLHLQCHFGQDTISLARMGAIATGVDFSDKAIDQARDISITTDVPATFICCDIYNLHHHLDEQFDIVFTSYGTIGWLPDLTKWAAVISRFLKPNGRFVFAEFHPVVWMFDSNFEKIQYNYFKDAAIREVDTGTYADVDAPIENETITWNHSIGEVVDSLIASGLTISELSEYDYSPYPCFNNTEEFKPGKWRVSSLGNKLPMVYSINAVKTGNK